MSRTINPHSLFFKHFCHLGLITFSDLQAIPPNEDSLLRITGDTSEWGLSFLNLLRPYYLLRITGDTSEWGLSCFNLLSPGPYTSLLLMLQLLRQLRLQMCCTWRWTLISPTFHKIADMFRWVLAIEITRTGLRSLSCFTSSSLSTKLSSPCYPDTECLYLMVKLTTSSQ